LIMESFSKTHVETGNFPYGFALKWLVTGFIWFVY
jgi:hypothetical protein